MARVAFCQDVAVEYMGYMYMSAVLKEAGHVVEVFLDDELHRKRILKEIVDFKPDVLGFSVLTPSMPWALEFSRLLKKETGAISIFGNVHAIVCPEIIESDGVDAVCLGEGEFALLDLCAALDAGKDYSHIEGLWVKSGSTVVKNERRAKCHDINELPFHDRSLYYKYAIFRRITNLRFLNGRGCPYSCSFCANKAIRERLGKGDYIRKLNPERAIAELQHTIRNHPVKVKSVFFIDEAFWITKPWLYAFLDLYKERVGLPFISSIQLPAIKEEDIKKMAETGAEILYIATETHDEEVRRGLLNKEVTNEQVFHIVDWLRKYKIQFGVSAFFGLPDKSVDYYLGGLAFYQKIKPPYLWTNFLQPYPGTSMVELDSVKALMPTNKAFPLTLHHEPFLDVPDRRRIMRLKRVYFLCARFPRTARSLVWLTKFNIPLLFDLLFIAHFTYYTFWVEKISVYHFLIHVRDFALRPLLKVRK